MSEKYISFVIGVGLTVLWFIYSELSSIAKSLKDILAELKKRG